MRLERVGLDGATVTLILDGGRIAGIEPATGSALWQVTPPPVDPHLHLDKTFTASRTQAPEPGLFGAIAAARLDRDRWTESDIRYRAGKALSECTEVGMTALRTHLDWPEPKAPLAWNILGEMASEWNGRIAIQRAPLVAIDLLGDPDQGPFITDQVARTGDGVIGAFVYRQDSLADRLERVFRLAADHSLALDFHVDEGLEPEARGFDDIVRLAGRFGLSGRVLCGHGCALSVRDGEETARVLNAAAEAGVGLCVLPPTNLWLQDAAQGRSPRLRGVAPVKEARAAGVEVMFGADNVADPFYPLGTYDPIETLRLATLASQLDPSEWIASISSIPARWLGQGATAITEGAAANFVLLPGADWFDALRRAGPRRPFRKGVEISDPKEVAA